VAVKFRLIHPLGMPKSESPSHFRLHHAAVLRELRKEAGLSQPALAGIIQRHRTWISKAESGDVNITVDTVDLIRSALLPSEQSKLPLRMRIAKHIFEARTGMNPPMSQEALSITAGCNIKYVSQLELGLVGTTLDQLAKVVDVLGLDYNEIFD
jgi:transcriptional regulator with XRE-family HTH domain